MATYIVTYVCDYKTRHIVLNACVAHTDTEYVIQHSNPGLFRLAGNSNVHAHSKEGNENIVPALQDTYLLQHMSGKRSLAPTQPSPPSTACAVCGTARLELAINTKTTTLARFIDMVCTRRFISLGSPLLVLILLT